MKFQPGDKVRYIDVGVSGGPVTGEIYTVSGRSNTDTGIHLHGFNHAGDWWLDRRFELYEQPMYVVLTNHAHEIPSGGFNPKLEYFTKAQKFTREELENWIEKNVNSPYDVFKCVPVKITVRTTIEIEE